MNDQMKDSFLSKNDLIVIIVAGFVAVTTLYLYFNEVLLFDFSDNHKGKSMGFILNSEKDVRKKKNGEYFWKDLNKEKNLLYPNESIFTGAESSVTLVIKQEKIVLAENSLLKLTFENNALSFDTFSGKIFFNNYAKKIILTDCGKSYEIDASKGNIELSKGSDCNSFKVKVKKGQVTVNQEKLKTNNFVQVKQNLLSYKKFIPKLFKKPEKIEIVETAKLEPEIKIDPPFRTITTDLVKKINKDGEFTLKWDKYIETNDGYSVLISTNPQFRNNVEIKTVKESLVYKIKNASTLYYQIASFSTKNNRLDVFQMGSITFNIEPLTLENKNYILTENVKFNRDIASTKKIKINWNKNVLAQKYNIKFYNARNEIYNTVLVTDNSLDYEIKNQDNFHYKIEGIDSKNNIFTESELGEVSYIKKLELSVPIVKLQNTAKSYYLQKGQLNYLKVNWDSEGENPQFFEFQLAKDENFKNIIVQKNLAENKIVLNKSFTNGVYYWRVRSKLDQWVSDWTTVNSVKVITKVETKDSFNENF